MKKKIHFYKSLYARFLTTFLGLWWLLNLGILGVMFAIVTQERMDRLYPVIKEVGGEFRHFKLYSMLACGASMLLGSVVILLVVRSVVRPIQTLSGAAREVAGGNFDVALSAGGQDELGLLAADFGTMAKALQGTEALRSQFVSSVSHEFRTPMTSIRGYVELLRDDAAHAIAIDDATKIRYCDIVAEESTRLIALSSDLMRLSALDNTVVRESVTFSVDEQLRKTILLLEPLWSKKEIEFELSLDEVAYTCGKDLLEQVWINLIANAIKFSAKRSKIGVSLACGDTEVLIGIADHGVGMSDETKARLFDPFFIGDKVFQGKGNGLGLAIVKRIIDQLHGRIEVCSALGRGTRMVVHLPAD